MNWISLADQQPPTDTRVLAVRIKPSGRTSMVQIVTWDSDGTWWLPCVGYIDPPTHWMFLPEPPETQKPPGEMAFAR